MNSRILTGAALTGMLAAAGCGGGTGSGISPTVGNSTGGLGGAASAARGTLSASFNVPARYVGSKTSSSARKPQYISPGSSGIEVLLGGNTATSPGVTETVAPTWIVGHSGAPLALTGSPGVSFSGNALSGSTIGFQAGAAVSYSYQPSSTLANYYTFTLTITGLQQSGTGGIPANYSIGVVLTDLSNHNFVLSEGQGYGAVAATPVFTPVQITLSPVVDKAYLVGPTLIGSTVVGSVALGTYEFTLYPADELGYVIPGSTAVTSFDQQTLAVAQSPSATVASGTAVVSTVAPNAAPGDTVTYPSESSTNPIPLSSTPADPLLLAGTAAGINSAGNAVSIAAPAGGLPNLAPVFANGSIYHAGVPINVAVGTATGVTGIGVFLTSPASGVAASALVSGYTVTPGLNFPNGGTNLIGTPSSVNFTPGIYPVVQ